MVLLQVKPKIAVDTKADLVLDHAILTESTNIQLKILLT